MNSRTNRVTVSTMKSYLAAASLAAAMLTAVSVRAAGTTIALYRLGENDPGAAAGLTGDNPTIAAVGGPNLSRIGSPTYTAATPLSTSALAMSFDGISSRYVAETPASRVNDNFAIEAWARADSTASSVVSVAYNGDSAFGGWGLYRFGASWTYLYGGVEIGPMAPVTVGAWTHLAVVRNAGTTTFYVNGKPFGAQSAAVPNFPVGGMAIGGNFRASGENFTGLVDEVRIFTFAPGQFAVSDLNLAPPPAADLSVVVMPPPTAPVTGTTASFTTTVSNAGPDAASNVVVTMTVDSQMVTRTIATLASGSSETFTIDAAVDCALADGTPIRATASVSSTTADPNGANNESTANTLASNPAPQFICPAAITATLPFAQTSMAIDYAVPVATDNCAAPPVSCAPFAGSLFPAGTTTVTCTATDSGSRTTSCSFPVTVLTASQQVDAIAALLAGLPLDAGNLNSLTSTLASAQKSLQSGHVNTAINQLGAATNKVQALLNSGRITSAAAQSVLAPLNTLISLLGH